MKQFSLTEIRMLAAEFVGTFFLTFVVAMMLYGTTFSPLTGGLSGIFLPLVVGITFIFLWGAFGSISGAHCNPLVSVGLAVFGRISVRRVAGFVVVQVIGALLAVSFMKLITNVSFAPDLNQTVPGILTEFMGAVILSMTAGFIATKRVSGSQIPLFIMAGVMMAVAVGITTGGGVINPALAIAFQSDWLRYVLMAFLGGIVGIAITVLFEDRTPETPSL